MTGPKYLIEFFPKYSVLFFGTQKSDSEPDCVDSLYQAYIQRLETRDHV